MSDGQTSSWPIPVRGRRSGLTSLELAMGASGPTTWARRFPSLRLEQPHSIRRLLVSAFLADSIQHIHSLRASGVMSSHAANACGSDASAFFKSAGISCTTPLEVCFCDIDKLSFRKLHWREDFSLSKECGSFGRGDVLTLRISLWSSHEQAGGNPKAARAGDPTASTPRTMSATPHKIDHVEACRTMSDGLCCVIEASSNGRTESTPQRQYGVPDF